MSDPRLPPIRIRFPKPPSSQTPPPSLPTPPPVTLQRLAPKIRHGGVVRLWKWDDVAFSPRPLPESRSAVFSNDTQGKFLPNPSALLHENPEFVQCRVFLTSGEPHQIWAVLDSFEGGKHVRKSISFGSLSAYQQRLWDQASDVTRASVFDYSYIYTNFEARLAIVGPDYFDRFQDETRRQRMRENERGFWTRWFNPT